MIRLFSHNKKNTQNQSLIKSKSAKETRSPKSTSNVLKRKTSGSPKSTKNVKGKSVLGVRYGYRTESEDSDARKRLNDERENCVALKLAYKNLVKAMDKELIHDTEVMDESFEVRHKVR